MKVGNGELAIPVEQRLLTATNGRLLEVQFIADQKSFGYCTYAAIEVIGDECMNFKTGLSADVRMSTTTLAQCPYRPTVPKFPSDDHALLPANVDRRLHR